MARGESTSNAITVSRINSSQTYLDVSDDEKRGKDCISRKERQGRHEQKFEARKRPRGPKFETNSNDQNKSNSKPTCVGYGVLDFPDS
jgi:hypothetical protein